jgi:D-xylose transport system permease protein
MNRGLARLPVPEPELASGAPGRVARRRHPYGRRLVGGLGPLPALVGLVLVWVIFQTANPRFLSAFNLTNLVLQIATIVTISVGVVLVLLLGEIDLSVGAVSGLCAAVTAVLSARHGVPAPLAIGAGLAAGAAIGGLQGLWVTRLRVPSFVVTLAGLLAWQGALLYVLGDTGTVLVGDPGITRLAGTFYPDALGWAVAAVVTAGLLAAALLRRRRRIEAGLVPAPLGGVLARVLALGAAVTAAVAVFNADRGTPLAALLCVGLVAGFDFLVTRTRLGRHVLAIGGNAEAARRAGVAVDRVRVTVFVLASTMAAAGGILGASRLLAVNQDSGSGDLLLNAIAAAVIGGTSLFGGRGSAWSALLGALVIGSISNGMDLLAVSSSVKFIVTGAVLLLATTVDAASRSRRLAEGGT